MGRAESNTLDARRATGTAVAQCVFRRDSGRSGHSANIRTGKKKSGWKGKGVVYMRSRGYASWLGVGRDLISKSCLRLTDKN